MLINEFGDLETLLDRAEEIKQPKRRETLIEKRAQIELSKKLVQLDLNTPLDFTLDDLEVRIPSLTRCWVSWPKWSSARSANASPKRLGRNPR